MDSIRQLIDNYVELFESPDNKKRLSLWERPEEGIRGEFQWHGIPAYSTDSGSPMPVTVECLDKIWEELLGLNLARFFTEPDYYLEYYLKIKIRKFTEFPDDTPLTMDIPIVFGVTHEAGILGQGVILDSGEEPSFAKASIVDENTMFPTEFNFADNPYITRIAIPFYERIRQIAGHRFHVIFPQWYRGPQGVALYIRGFQEFSLDLYLNPDFAHRLLRYVTDAAKAFNIWRSAYTGDPIMPGDLFNDDIPLMSPEMYRDFFFKYEQELSDFYGGIYYWHSCGDVSRHVAEIHKLPDVHLFDFGVTMEKKFVGLEKLSRSQTVEFRVMAQTHIQQCSEKESKDYIRSILNDCQTAGVEKYIMRSSGMSVVDGAAEDVKKLARWVGLVREVQQEFAS